jgi:hypothetical protein
MRLFLVLFLAAGVPALALAQEAPEGDDVRSADEIPEDMPDPPEDAPPAEAPPVDGTDERPPHPETPEDLEELQPTAETLGKTSYHWLPGHWMWTGEQFEWKSGEWVYKVKDMILVPPRWEWDGKQWVFHRRADQTSLQTPSSPRRHPPRRSSHKRQRRPCMCIPACTLRR